MARKWYYARGGERYGPVPAAEIKKLIEDGKVRPDDFVWAKGMATWQRAAEVPQFAVEARTAEDAEEEPAPVDEREEGEVAGGAAPPEMEAIRPREPEAVPTVAKPAGAAAGPTTAAPARAPRTRAVPRPAPVVTQKSPSYPVLTVMRHVFAVGGLLLAGLGALNFLVFLMAGGHARPGLDILGPLTASMAVVATGLLLVAVGGLIKVVVDARRELWHIRRHGADQ